MKTSNAAAQAAIAGLPENGTRAGVPPGDPAGEDEERAAAMRILPLRRYVFECFAARRAA
jgi:hypothetical protein